MKFSKYIANVKNRDQVIVRESCHLKKHSGTKKAVGSPTTITVLPFGLTDNVAKSSLHLSKQ